MGANIQGGGSRRGGRRGYRPMAEINVTPLVDVMLVLLIVFMVAAPLLTAGVAVDLPETQAQNLPGQDEPLAISIDASGRIYLQESAVALDELEPRLIAITNANPDVRLFIRGDTNINYGRVMQVMGLVNAAGYKKVALITNPVEAK